LELSKIAIVGVEDLQCFGKGSQDSLIIRSPNYIDVCIEDMQIMLGVSWRCMRIFWEDKYKT
jgi:hypothetical protein